MQLISRKFKVVGTVTAMQRVGPVIRARIQQPSGRSDEVYVLRDSIAGRRLERSRSAPVEVEAVVGADRRAWVQYVRDVFVL